MIDFPFFTLPHKDAPSPDNLLEVADNFLEEEGAGIDPDFSEVGRRTKK